MLRTVQPCFREEIPQRDPLSFDSDELLIESTDAEFEWTDQPTIVLVERFEGRTALEIQWTNVTTLFDFAPFVLEYDSNRQALRTAHIGPVFINATCSFLVEKCTATHSMRRPVPQEIRMGATDPFGLDLRNREIVHTANRTTSPTLQSLCMNHRERLRLDIDLVVKTAQGGQGLFG
jgi:hypothetical protein